MFWSFANSDDTIDIRAYTHFPSVLQTLAALAALVVALTMAGCDSLGEQQEEEELAVLRTLPSDQLEQLVEQEPAGFTWDIYAEELEVIGNLASQDPARDCTSVQAVSIRAVGSDSGEPEIIDTTQTKPVTVPIDRLTEGVKTSDLYSAPGLPPLFAEEQFPSDAFSPVSTNNPLLLGDPVDPQEAPGGVPLYIANQVLGDRELGPDQAIVVTYFAPGGVPLYDRPAPLGLILEQQAE